MNKKFSYGALQSRVLSWIWLVFLLQTGLCWEQTLQRETPGHNNSLPSPIRLREQSRHVVIHNGLVEITLAKASGSVTKIKYGGINNLLEIHGHEDDRGYFDLVWYYPGHPGKIDRFSSTKFRIIMENEDQIEVSFKNQWDPSANGGGSAPLNVDKRYILQRGSPGFYMYFIVERLEGWPDVDMDQFRVVFKLQQDKFHYMAIADDVQRVMPTNGDRKTGRRLDYKEAVLLTHPSNSEFQGEVDDKYQYSMENKDIKLKGWISKDPPVGFWVITPSFEYCAGGPVKQELTSHVGPTVLATFTGLHYAGKDLNTAFRDGEPWKKVFGPIFIYLNSMPRNASYSPFWNDAKRQMLEEVHGWPYDFVQSKDFPPSYQRGAVGGRLAIPDGYTNRRFKGASKAYVGLAAPGEAGSWQLDSKGYQFWTRAKRNGDFYIKNVRPGTYNLYAWVPGVIGEYKYNGNITITPGGFIGMGILRYVPPRNGPTLWEIGVPDRSAAEFFVPDPNPNLYFPNSVYSNKPEYKYRQYGLWNRYTDLYPHKDLVYNVGSSNYSRDWFFAHVTRLTINHTHKPTTWQVNFELQHVNPSGTYTLQLALASAFASHLNVWFNFQLPSYPLFSVGPIGKDDAIARHGIHGLYRLYSIRVPGYLLLEGWNTMYLKQSRGDGPFNGIMYDYIRLEGLNWT